MDLLKRHIFFVCIISLSLLLMLTWVSPVVAQDEEKDEEGGSEKAKPSDKESEKKDDKEKEKPSSEESDSIEFEADEVPMSTLPKKDMRSEDGLVSLDFTNTDINEIVKTMSEMTGRNFMVDASVAGQVTIISPTKVTPQEAYDIFLSVLAVNGFTTVEVGKITKIIPRKDAKQNPIPTISGRIPRATDAIITQLIPIDNIDSNDVASAFASLVGPDGDLFAYGPANMVIISDAASNVNRLYRIIKQLDTEGAEQVIEVIPIEYANAEMLAEMIEQLFQEGLKSSVMQSAARRFSSSRSSRRTSRSRSSRATSSRYKQPSSTNIPSQTIPNIIADARTNSLIVKSSSYGIKRVQEIVNKLDRPLPGGEGKIHVIYLQNADAEEMAATLSELATGGTGGVGSSRRNTQRGSTRNTGLGRNTRAGQISSALGGRMGNTGRNSASGRGGIAQTSGRLFADFDGAVRVTADPPTNSLVIIASNRDYKILKEVIDKLDIPRRQVFVEAVIMEITMDRGLDLGFEFRSTNNDGSDGIQVIGGTNYGGITEAAANPLGVAGFAIGAADGTMTYNGTEYPNIGALFRAMQTDKDVNVLSTPNILTMDNEEAEIVVADNIPFVTGQIFSANNSNPTTTIERKDVGITLRITPQINESDFIRLDIYQESSQVTDSPEGLAAAQVGVTTSKRTTQNLVVVKNQQTVILGGLMKDIVSTIEAEIPVLGDIPILGYLFKSSKKRVEKTNLLIFLTPYVIKNAADLEEVTRMSNERMRVFRDKMRSTNKSLMEGQYLRERNLTPTEDIFRAPRQGTIETDPRLRRQQEGNTEPREQGDEESDAETETVPVTGEDAEPVDEEEPFEDFTEESEG